MGDGSRDDGSWSRAFMASSGMGAMTPTTRRESPERHEASGAALSPARFAELAHHRDPEVREELARRNDCPVAVMATLAHDARAAVRVAVASNPAANQAVIAHLGRDRVAAVLKAVARNRATAAEVRESLARHRRPEVRQVAQRALDEGLGTIDGTDAINASVPYELRDRAAAATRGSDAAATETRTAPRTYAPRPSIDRVSAPDPDLRGAPSVDRFLLDGRRQAHG